MGAPRYPNRIGHILRCELGETQSRLAEKLGINLEHFNRIVNGHVEPRVRMARRIARALGKTVEDVWPDKPE